MKMGIKTVPHSPYSPCDFRLFPKLKEKLRGCRYETIEEMKEAVTKVIDTVTQEDFRGAFQKLLERYNTRARTHIWVRETACLIGFTWYQVSRWAA